MPAAVSLRTDFSAGELRRLAATTKNASQSRRLLSLAAVLDGMNRTQAARIGGMDRQTLRDWVHRFNERGPDGLKTLGRRATRPASRPISRQTWRASSRPARIEPCMASCAGGGSTSSASFSIASGSPITSARWASSSRLSASRTSAPVRVTRLRMGARSSPSKKLARDPERPSGQRRSPQADRALVPDAMEADFAEIGGVHPCRGAADVVPCLVRERCLPRPRAQLFDLACRITPAGCRKAKPPPPQGR
jgi:transposase-like protein